MTIDPTLVTAAFGGLVALVGAVGGILGIRGRRVEVTRREYRRTRNRLHIALVHIDRLGDRLARNGVNVPPRPAGLDDEDDQVGDEPATTRRLDAQQ